VLHLRHLELAANPITTLSNASFQGAIENLRTLDVRDLTLIYFEVTYSTAGVSLEPWLLSCSLQGITDGVSALITSF
jgi:hypothetical protein